jgi:hypothetical protein
MPDISERNEIRIRGRDHTIVFIADSQDGRLVIRQEPDGKKSKVPGTVAARTDIGNRTRTMKIYAFDVDDTLEVSGGPVSIVSVGSLKPQGHIVGLNGNWAVVVQTVPLWHRIFSFVGPMEMSKDTFLNQLKTYIPADDYIMVGNIKGVSGASDDEGAANLAGWRFIKESDFAAGAR